jgi:hypothetical protein
MVEELNSLTKHTHQISSMKTTMIGKILLTIGLVCVLGSAITPVHGSTQSSDASVTGPADAAFPVVTINSVTAVTASGVTGSFGVVTRGQIGAFVLSVKPQILFATTFVNFKVSGTAIPGVDYTPLVSPAFIGQSGFGVILVTTLPDRRAGVIAQAQSVVVTLEPGPGYAVGQPSSAKILIAP